LTSEQLDPGRAELARTCAKPVFPLRERGRWPHPARWRSVWRLRIFRSSRSHAKQVGAQVIGVVGRDGGYTAKVADACVIVPTVNPETITPHAEAFQAVIWHLLVSHPSLKAVQTKWESTVEPSRA